MQERTNADFSPAVAAPGRLAGAIEQTRNLFVGHLARECAHQCQCVLARRSIGTAIHLVSFPVGFRR
jgi:hypothetical protein